jgi:hypothetical protein
MPKRKETLESVKTRLVREQRIRTERRVRDLLRQRETSQHSETFEDSDEENQISPRTVRARRDQATQTDRSSVSFCCGVIVGVVVVVSLLVCLIVSTKNDRQRLEE